MTTPQHPFNAIIVGPYKDTRIVEQFTCEFESYMWLDTENITGFELWEYIESLKVTSLGGPLLVLIKINPKIRLDYLSVQVIHRALYNARHSNISILFLDKDGCSKSFLNAANRQQISQVYIASVPISECFIKEFFRQYDFYDTDKILSVVREAEEGSWCEIRRDGSVLPFYPWPRHVEWKPECHLNFPSTVHKRILLLLMAQYDEASWLSKLDRNSMLELLRCGAGMDEYVPQHCKPKLELDSATVVFTKSSKRESYWNKRGVPGIFIYNSGVSYHLETFITRQREILQKTPDKIRPIYIIIDQVPYETSRYQLIDEKLEIYFIDSQLWNINVNLPEIMYQMAESCAISM